jgi:carbonic anhydrase/acetyltransferase-like protein (isoleucine patch superfamily)
MGAVVLDGAEIGDDCIIGAHSLVTMNTKIPAGSMVFGSPAKVIRPLRSEELAQIRESAESYVQTAREYGATLGRGW